MLIISRMLSVSIKPHTLKLCGAFMLEIIKYHDKGPLLIYLYICGFWNLPLLALAFSVEVTGLSFSAYGSHKHESASPVHNGLQAEVPLLSPPQPPAHTMNCFLPLSGWPWITSQTRFLIICTALKTLF